MFVVEVKVLWDVVGDAAGRVAKQALVCYFRNQPVFSQLGITS